MDGTESAVPLPGQTLNPLVLKTLLLDRLLSYGALLRIRQSPST